MDFFHIFISKLCNSKLKFLSEKKIDKQKSEKNVNFVFKVTNSNYNFFGQNWVANMRRRGLLLQDWLSRLRCLPYACSTWIMLFFARLHIKKP